MTRILLAVSGGIDSMYMAYRASELFPGARFAVAHCNFTLRGGESDGDEAFVKEWCRAHGVEFLSKRFDTARYAGEHSLSIEMAARELRYAWFAQLCSEHGFEAVAVAHNANDNAETLLLNLLRGTGIRGISGMGGRLGVLRPLLGIERDEIRRWMEERGFGWREDSTNSENEYKRNRLRNEVFPVLKELNPSFIRTLNEDMARFAQVRDIAEDYFIAAREKVLLPGGGISVPALREFPHRDYVLWRLLEDSGIGRSEFESLKRAIDEGGPAGGKRFGPVEAVSSELRIRKPRPARELHCEIIRRQELGSLKQEEGTLIADRSKLSWPLKIRPWQAGDWMRPLGMGGRRKKLSDIFTDLGWSAQDKEEAEVIELDGHHVAALLCCRIDEGVKVGEDCVEVVRMSYRPVASI